LALIVVVSAGFNLARATNVGLFGSKNNFGLAVAMMLPVGWAVAAERRQPIGFRLLGVAAVIGAPPLLLQSDSTGALICSLATAGVVCGALALSRLTPAARVGTLVLLTCAIAMPVVAWLSGGDLDQVLNAVGKDTTLTGRTALWSAAGASILAHPTLGVGYQAYWQVGSWGGGAVMANLLRRQQDRLSLPRYVSRGGGRSRPDRIGDPFGDARGDAAPHLARFGVFANRARIAVWDLCRCSDAAALADRGRPVLAIPDSDDCLLHGLDLPRRRSSEDDVPGTVAPATTIAPRGPP
jgi:hypothetical protein